LKDGGGGGGGGGGDGLLTDAMGGSGDDRWVMDIRACREIPR